VEFGDPENQPDTGDPQWPDGWKGDVLRIILPKIFTSVETDQCLISARDHINGGGVDELASLAAMAIGRDLVREGKNLRKALNLIITDEENEDE
jgi:hypothetical protein